MSKKQETLSSSALSRKAKRVSSESVCRSMRGTFCCRLRVHLDYVISRYSHKMYVSWELPCATLSAWTPVIWHFIVVYDALLLLNLIGHFSQDGPSASSCNACMRDARTREIRITHTRVRTRQIRPGLRRQLWQLFASIISIASRSHRWQNSASAAMTVRLLQAPYSSGFSHPRRAIHIGELTVSHTHTPSKLYIVWSILILCTSKMNERSQTINSCLFRQRN